MEQRDWRDRGSLNKVLSTQVQQPEFTFFNTHVKRQAW